MIKESNWARASLGTQVIEVSHEATHLSSSATNLLLEQEDALWVAGEAPQHVMLKLPAAHPPLRYAGWHVWHDYVTNPQLVEVSSGETTDRLTAMHLCRALPGAGTQIWKLTQPIPAHHVYVRYKILQSFGPGPTYMNSIVLLASDPGPRYRSNPNSPKATVAGAFTSTPPNRNPSSATESPGIRIPPAPPVMHTTTTTTTATEQFSSTNRQGASTLYQDARSPHVDGVYATQQHQRRDQGFVVAEQHGRAVGTTLSYANNVSDSSSRLSQLLQDLDEDIRLLKPIKSVTANTTDWRYVPDGGSTTLLIADGVPDESQTTQTPSHFRRGSTSIEKKVRAQRVTEVEEEEEEEEQSGRHASHRRSSRQRRTPHDRSSSHDHMRSTSSSARHPRRSHHRHSSSRHRHESAPGEGRLTAAHSESHRSHGHGSGFMAPPCHHVEDVALRHRLTSLEQHVATLTQTMDAQQEDLSTIKRLLVHQAMLERQRTTAQAAQVADSPSGTVGGAQPPSMEDTRKGKTETTQAPPSPSTVDITFPEPALRGFVESLMAHKLHKYFRKSEAKYLRRVDAHLHDIVTAFSQAVDDRVQAHLGVPPSLDYGYAPLTYAPPATAPPPAPAPAPVVLPHHLGCPDVAALQPPPVAARLPAGQRAYRPASVPPPPRPSEAMCTPHTSSGPYAPHPAPAYAVYTPPGGVLEGHGVSTPSAHQYNFVSPNPNGFRPSSSRGSIPISIIRTSSEQAYAAATAA